MDALNRACQDLAANDCIEMANDPELNGLKSLTLSANEIGNAGCEALSKAPWASTLEALIMTEADVGDRGLKHLMSAFTTLKSLDLMANDLSEKALSIIGAAPCREHLKDLSLFANWLEDGVSSFVDHSWPCLQVLNLGANELGQGLNMLLAHDMYPVLNTLQLANVGMSDEALNMIGQISTLTTLDIARNSTLSNDFSCLSRAKFRLKSFNIGGVSSIDFTQLLEASALAELEHINLSGVQLNDAQVAPIFQAAWPLRSVSLDSNQLTTKSMTTLRDADWAQSLQILSLCYNELTDESIAQLLVNDTFPKLRRLDLSENHLTNDGIRTLLDWDGFEQLETLFISGDGLSDAIRQALGETKLDVFYA